MMVWAINHPSSRSPASPASLHHHSHHQHCCAIITVSTSLWRRFNSPFCSHICCPPLFPGLQSTFFVDGTPLHVDGDDDERDTQGHPFELVLWTFAVSVSFHTTHPSREMRPRVQWLSANFYMANERVSMSVTVAVTDCEFWICWPDRRSMMGSRVALHHLYRLVCV